MEDLGQLRQREDDVRGRLEKIRARLQACVAATRELSRLEDRVAVDGSGAAGTSRFGRVAVGAYRTDASVLADKVATARAARAERALLRTEEAALMMDLEEIRERLEKRGIKHVALPMLDDVQIAAPCDVSWSSMEGDSDVRYCGSCRKHVYNLSMMSRAEAEAVLVAAKATEVCVRLYRRADGTVITDDCPVGVRRRRFWRRTSGVAAAGILLAALGGILYQQLACEVHVAGTSATAGARM